MTAGMTHGEFAMQAARLAGNAAYWASDALVLPEHVNEPVRPEVVSRFLKKMRDHLNYIEKDSATRPVPDATGEGR